ncbi:Zn-dependent hydrolase [Aeribacillus sp. FSL K6-2833]|uniref:Zn-dependent hydrolase n=1 Tax=Aeribacillus sp. FSL K6-2833 TaxID=2954611 RepID=UPI0030DC57B2
MIKINVQRLMKHIKDLSKFGHDPNGGVTRFPFTDEEREAKQYIVHLMKQIGLEIYEDEIGNLFGKRVGTDSALPSILIGSHLDTVKNGGMFDGALGVLAGIEILQTMMEQGIQTRHSISVAAFTDEEGVRFSTGMLGSRALTGELQEEELFQYKDENGISIADAMVQCGYNPKLVHRARRCSEEFKAFLELHIEQGKVLESEQAPVGIVTGIVGVKWLKVTIRGEEGHAGTTPMAMRKDPVTVAARLIDFVEQKAQQSDGLRATVGSIRVFPGSINVIPREVELFFDIRHLSWELICQMEDDIQMFLSACCNTKGMTFTVEATHELKPVSCSPVLIEAIQTAAKRTGTKFLMLPSGAAHDAMILASLTKIGMVFVRSKDGISHSPLEWSDVDDIEAAANILLHALLDIAEAEKI